MRPAAIALYVALCGCGGFEFEVIMVTAENDVEVVVDGEPRQGSHVDGLLQISFGERFASYSDATAVGHIEATVLFQGQAVLDASFRPGACTGIGTGLDMERQYVSLLKENDVWSTQLSKVECWEGSKKSVIVN